MTPVTLNEKSEGQIQKIQAGWDAGPSQQECAKNNKTKQEHGAWFGAC